MDHFLVSEGQGVELRDVSEPLLVGRGSPEVSVEKVIWRETVVDTGDRPIVHSDRGAYYRWPGWLSRIADAKLIRSMSRKGCSPGNAACEGFFGRLKTEWFYPGNWQSTTVEQFTQALDSCIRWYNEKRIKMSLGARSPLDYRRSLGLMA